MELLQKNKLIKFKKKNKGNKILIEAVNRLISTVEEADWKQKSDVKTDRPDADCVHSDGFYFFNIDIHRTMIMLLFDDDEASVVWVGSHDEYEATFRNNKGTIQKWLRKRDYIE